MSYLSCDFVIRVFREVVTKKPLKNRETSEFIRNFASADDSVHVAQCACIIMYVEVQMSFLKNIRRGKSYL